MNERLDAGGVIPPFELEANGGTKISNADLAGRLAVLFFYPKDDTPGCTKEAIAFTALKPRFEAANIHVVGFSPDTVAKHDKFSAKHALDVRLAADPALETLKAFGVWVEKSMYGRTYFGVERTTFLVDGTGKVLHVWRKVKVNGHAETVLEHALNLK